jgi:hypothetical protein
MVRLEIDEQFIEIENRRADRHILPYYLE